MLSSMAYSFNGVMMAALQICIPDEALGAGIGALTKKQMGTCTVSRIGK